MVKHYCTDFMYSPRLGTYCGKQDSILKSTRSIKDTTCKDCLDKIMREVISAKMGPQNKEIHFSKYLDLLNRKINFSSRRICHCGFQPGSHEEMLMHVVEHKIKEINESEDGGDSK